MAVGDREDEQPDAGGQHGEQTRADTLGERRPEPAREGDAGGGQRLDDQPSCQPFEVLSGIVDRNAARVLKERKEDPDRVRALVAGGGLTQPVFVDVRPRMTKHGGRYYLQYGAPGTEYNVYANGTYVGDSPLGPFSYAPYNPIAYKPGGFMTGAGHGSTFQDKFGNWWNTGTPWVAVNWNFERRISMFPAGFDADGDMFASTRVASLTGKNL